MDAIIDNYRVWVKGGQHEMLTSALNELIQQSGFTVLNFIDHAFDPQGYTALWLLAESHCALHTFPEKETSYVELSSCNRAMYDRFVAGFETSFDIVKTDQ